MHCILLLYVYPSYHHPLPLHIIIHSPFISSTTPTPYHPPLPIHHSPSILSSTPPPDHPPLPLHIIHHSPFISSNTPPVCAYVLASKYLYFSSFIFIVGGLISWPHSCISWFRAIFCPVITRTSMWVCVLLTFILIGGVVDDVDPLPYNIHHSPSISHHLAFPSHYSSVSSTTPPPFHILPLPLHIIHHSPSISPTTPPPYHPPLPLHIFYHSPSISSSTPPPYHHPLPLHIIHHSPSISSCTTPPSYHHPLPLHLIHQSPSKSSTTPPSYHPPLPLHIINHSPSISSSTPPPYHPPLPLHIIHPPFISQGRRNRWDWWGFGLTTFLPKWAWFCLRERLLSRCFLAYVKWHRCWSPKVCGPRLRRASTRTPGNSKVRCHQSIRLGVCHNALPS